MVSVLYPRSGQIAATVSREGGNLNGVAMTHVAFVHELEKIASFHRPPVRGDMVILNQHSACRSNNSITITSCQNSNFNSAPRSKKLKLERHNTLTGAPNPSICPIIMYDFPS